MALELPTYPYEAENSIGVLNKIKMQIDLYYRKELKKYIDFIVTFYEGHKELFGIPVEVIPNGFDFPRWKWFTPSCLRMQSTSLQFRLCVNGMDMSV